MNERRGGGFGWFLFGFLLGGLVGAAVALIYTPESGEEMQERLREGGIDLRGRVEEIAEKARERLEELREQAREQMGQMREQFEQMQAGRKAEEVEIEITAEGTQEAEETA
jgi:gas vesicle protein